MVKFLVAVVEDGFSDVCLQERHNIRVSLSLSEHQKELLQMNELAQAKDRPVGVTILAVLAGIPAVLIYCMLPGVRSAFSMGGEQR